MEKVKVLHLYDNYLPKSQQWNFNLISQLNTFNYIAAPFYSNSELFLKWPFLKYRGDKDLGIDLNEKWAVRNFLSKSRNRWRRLWNTWGASLSSYINLVKPDIIHVHFASTAFENLATLHKAKIPVIVSFYGWDYEAYFRKKSVGQSGMNAIFTLASAIAVEGPFGKNKLIAIGAEPKKIFEIPLGIVIEPQTRLSFRNVTKEFKLVQVANFEMKKGHTDTVKAFHLALKSDTNLHLTLVGDGPEKEKVKKYIEVLGIEDYINMMESVEYGGLSHFLRQFDAFIHPSVTTSEGDCEGGSPTVLFDAMYAGLPILSTYHCDIPNVVTHGINSLLCLEGDSSALANNILQLAHLPTVELERFRQNAFSNVCSRFDISQNAKRLEELYVEILKNN